MSDVVIRVENISKLYRLGEVGTGSLAHDVNRWWHKVRGKEDPYLKIGEVNDRTKPVSSAQRPESSAKKRSLTTEDTIEHRGRCEKEQPWLGPKGEGVGTTESKSTERGAGRNQRSDSAEFSEGHSQAGLQMDSEKHASIRSANAPRSSAEQKGSDSASAEIGEICGKNAEGLRPGEFWAVQDVSFELRRGECLGLIGHNGAGKTTLLKMLNGLIKPDRGTITMRGRVGALIALGAGFNPILTGREPKG